MICNHLSKLLSQVLINRLCCVLIHAPSFLSAEEEYPDKREQRGRLTCHPRCCVSEYISVVILTLSLNPSMKASFSDRAISDS